MALIINQEKKTDILIIHFYVCSTMSHYELSIYAENSNYIN